MELYFAVLCDVTFRFFLIAFLQSDSFDCCCLQHGNPRKWFGSSNETQRGSTGGRISFKTMSFESNA